jgi:serine/threonine protein kinase
MTKSNNDKTQANQALAAGSSFSHYKIISKIGAGGMGEVYLAEDTKLNRQVALKFLTFEQSNNVSVNAQFIKEAQAAARLQHPNIITVHEVNEHQMKPYISMEYINGHSLKEISREKTLSVQGIIELGIQISNGLATAHEKGITHRDLKPGNIMVDNTGTVKILDFGLAIFSDIESIDDPDKTVTSNPFANKMAGTILYMSPEQLLGQEINSKVDIFSFGVIMYELITAEHPFDAPSVSEISARILRDTPERLIDKRIDIPYDLNRIISRCLNKNPDKRFQTARDVSNELEELSNQLKQDITVNVGDKDSIKQTSTFSEESFVLTTELVRKLSEKDPRMIGTKMAYADNGVASDELVFFLHGIGNDHRLYSEMISQIPYRAVAISMYGFDRDIKLRLPISLDDHSILMHAFLKDLCSRLQPQKVVMVGFSSGADHILHFISDSKFDDINVTGLMPLGCNVHIDDCFATSKLSELSSGDESQILATIKKFSENQSTMNNWLLINNYLVTAFTKFGTQTEPLKQYAEDIMKPFVNGDLIQFPKWYKNSIKKVPHVRFVFDTGGYKTLEMIIREHLENNVLGDDFREDTIVKVPVSHMELGQPENVYKYTMDLMRNLL